MSTSIYRSPYYSTNIMKASLLHSDNPHQIDLIAKPTKSDVLCGRGGAVNSHEGNVRFRSLVFSLKEEYFSEKTRKLEKANIARRIMGQVHSLDPPGRFLKQDTSTKLWVEITDEKAKKKVGQAFRDIISPDDRSRIVFDDIAADATTTESEKVAIATYIDSLNQETAKSTKLQLDCTVMPPLPALPPPLQPVEEAAGDYDCPSSPEDPSTDSPRIDMGICDHVNTLYAGTSMQGSGEMREPNDQTCGYSTHGDTRSALYQNTSNTAPSTLHEKDSKLEHKIPRLPIAEFSLYPQYVNDFAEAESEKQAQKRNKDTCSSKGDDTSRSDVTGVGSIATSEIEKVTVDMLVKRARIWEDMYYSERDYSRKLEDHLVAIIGDRQRLPKRRKHGY